MRRSLGLGLAISVLTAPMAASAQDDPNLVIAPPEDELIVRGGPFTQCFKRPGDPLDLVNVSNPGEIQQVIQLDKSGNYILDWDNHPITGPHVWQRAGKSIHAFNFRVPTDGSPMCIGNRSGGGGHGQFRRILNARDYAGKYVRFTAFFATPKNTDVRVWVAAGNSVSILTGDPEGQNIRGTGQWEPVSVTIGRIAPNATKLSYGFLLAGRGDVWVTRVKFEVFDRRPEDTYRR